MRDAGLILCGALLVAVPAGAATRPGAPPVDVAAVNPLLPAPGLGTALLQSTGDAATPAAPGAVPQAASPRAYVLPVVLSAIVPGTGEIASGHFWRGIPFVAIDVATWWAYGHYQSEGKDWRSQYERFADEHWHYTGDANGNGSIDFGETPGWQENLQDYYDGQHGATYDFWDTGQPYNCTCPYIPKEEDAQHYYENIGKYLFYYSGWDDWDGNGGQGDPAKWDSRANRATYTDMRIQSNDNFDKGTDMIVVAMATRLASVVQSVLLVRGDRQRASLELQPVRTSGRGHGVKLSYHY